MHLFVLITERCDNHSLLAVPICTIDAAVKHDDACVIAPGEHEFIRFPSYAMYKFARVLHSASISKMVALKSYVVRDDATEDLCLRLGHGLLNSRFVSRHIKQYFINGGY